MEGSNTFWLVNSVYNDVQEFHFSSKECSFVVYFRDKEPIFVLDNTCDIISPNNLLIIEALPEDRGEKNPKTKWDSILKTKFGIDPIKIRPKENTKYKKLDISYSDLSLYKAFSENQSDELFDSIMKNKELLSLDNAYERESENLLNYNKSTQTIEKATVTLENLKKKILHLTKRLKHQEELADSNPEKVDEALKAELIQKMYDNTEKLKRTERRIKRAKKRSTNAFDDLSLIRSQIQEIKNRLNLRDEKNSENRILSKFNYPDSVSEQLNYIEKIPQNQDVENRKIESLTIENINANNDSGEKIGTTLPVKENIMVKETENKNSKVTTEFKPPFVDDTVQDTSKDSGVKFAHKTDVLDDKYKKVWMYVASVMVSLIIVFGLFFLLSGEGEETYVDNSNYVEQNYQEPTAEPASEQPVEEVAYVEETVSEPAPSEETPAEPIVEEAPVSEPTPTPVEEPAKVVTPAPVSAPKAVSKPVSKVKPAPKKAAPTPKKVENKPVVEEEVVEDDEDLTNIPEEDDEDTESDTVIESVEFEDNEEANEAAETAKNTALEIAKKEYVENVIAGDQYLTLIAYLRNNFFTLEDDSKIAELEKMNHYWNDFRNASYDAYYENDYTLKENINYEEYANDEYLLRLFTNSYYDFYEYVINEFVMKYEYANNTATALYAAIENELDVLGRPLAKLEILARVYNAIQAQGGAAAVLSAIAEKDEAETAAADSMEIEASLIPLTATTEIVYQENIYSDDDTDVVNQDSTEVVTDFTKEYAESDEIITPVVEESTLVDEENEDVAEVATVTESENVAEDVEESAPSEIATTDTSSEDEENEEDSVVETVASDVITEDVDTEDESVNEVAADEDIDSDEESEDVATANPTNLEVVVEDDSEEVASIEPTTEETPLMVEDSAEEDVSSEEGDYFAENDSEENEETEETEFSETDDVEEENV